MNTLKNISRVVILLLLISACDITNDLDPNRPSPEGFTQNPTAQQLNLLVTGTLSQMRVDLPIYIDAVGVVGREHYRYSGSDPRFVGDLLGAGGGTLDDNAFYTTRTYTGRYASVKNTNLIIEGATNTTSATVTEEGRQAFLGFARTIQAYELLMALNQQFEGGIRTNVADPDNLGPFEDPSTALGTIANLLEEGAANLDNAGSTWPVQLSSGFADFNSTAGFRQFNRALAARVAVYRQQWDQALSILNESFLDLAGDLDLGAYHNFSANAGDLLNTLWIAPNSTGDLRAAHPSWLADAEPGDNRLENAVERDTPFQNTGLTFTHDVLVYETNVDDVPIIRNGELILIYAEALINRNTGSDLTDAENALNVIRNAADLPNYSGAVSQNALLDEMLNQRRYELWFEGHRWVDMRRYDRLDELTIDRTGDIVHESFPRPFNEKGVQGG